MSGIRNTGMGASPFSKTQSPGKQAGILPQGEHVKGLYAAKTPSDSFAANTKGDSWQAALSKGLWGNA